MLRVILLSFLCIPWLQAAEPFPLPTTEQAAPPLVTNNILSQVDITTLSDVQTVKMQIQLKYASNVAQQAILYLSMYEKRFAYPINQDAFNRYTQTLLSDDPFIAYINYQPQYALDLVLHNNLLLAPKIKGLILSYSYEHGLWRFSGYGFNQNAADATLADRPPDEIMQIEELDPTMTTNIEKAGAGVPYHLDVIYAYGIITDHCKEPIGYRTEENKLFDTNWCPAWHNAVMSPY